MLIRNKRHSECVRASIWTPTSHNLQENNVEEEEDFKHKHSDQKVKRIRTFYNIKHFISDAVLHVPEHL